MAWKIIGPTNDETTIEALVGEYPDLVAYEDGSELPVYVSEGGSDTECLDGAGHDSRILFWATEADSAGTDGAGDDGRNAIAEARWEDEESAA